MPESVRGRGHGGDGAVPAAEIGIVCLIGAAAVVLGWRIAGGGVFARQAAVWGANLVVLVTIGIGLRARGQTWKHLGLPTHWGGWTALGRTVVQSIVVLVFALVAFAAGSVVMMNGTGATAGADMSSYAYLEGNLPMLLLVLAAVYVGSSFGEEVLYRGFLITRLEEAGGGSKRATAIAVVVSALVFGLAHFDWGIAGIVQTAFMGVAFAISYVATARNLWALILAHACLDTLLLAQLYLGASGRGGA